VKEALKKCDPELLAEEMKNIELAFDESGGPFLCRHVAGEARRLPHAVSMSHTLQAAIAVVVKLNGPAPAGAAVRPLEKSPPIPAAVFPPPPDTSLPPRGTPGLWIGLISLTALALSVFALWRTIHV
jgi:hypothetical protein